MRAARGWGDGAQWTAMLLAIACAGCAPELPPRPNVVLISLDTTRADALGARSESGSDLTPRLDAFARANIDFRSSYAPVPFTLSSHMTLFTGLRPDVHGVGEKDDRLSLRATTLPERLKEAGYETKGVVTNAWMNGEYGFSRGFDDYEELAPGPTFADRVNASALQWLDERATHDRPFFLFLHYLDAHSDWKQLPYDSPPEYRRDLRVRDDDFCSPSGVCATRFLIAADRQDGEIPAEATAMLKSLYLRGVSYLDARIGELFDGLRERSLLEGALVIVTSDHGEEFQEHGRFLHGQPVEETLAVPLILKLPNPGRGGTAQGAGQTITSLTSLADVLPTVLEMLALPLPDDVEGHSLLPLVRGRTNARETVVSRGTARRRYSIRDERFRLYVERSESGAEAPRLFELETDPFGQRDVAAEHPTRVAHLLATLEAEIGADLERARRYPPDKAEGGILDPEEERWLESLGYVVTPGP